MEPDPIAVGASIRREPIRRLAIVNRGEAAMRCLRAVKSLRVREGSSIQAIALYTDSDRDAPFVRHADTSVRLPAPRGEVAAFLDHELLLGALRSAGADAAWPGWGFVAEDPVFAERLAAEGIRFLGPSPEAMRLLGDKITSKLRAEKAGVPVIPWSGGAVEDVTRGRSEAEAIGYPVLLKASAGGGGRGIRVVEEAAGFEAAFASARSEAQAAFGDPRLFVEKLVPAGRHVEVQIVADQHGHVRSLGCRDCSVQRRHQKVIEETPPPGLPEPLLRALEQAAVRLAESVGYSGAGTVEFLVEAGSFAFLEMNPRLQVEHGITEATTGLDLVELQIRIARGESLAGLEVAPSGAAIEARVCAEDPDAGFAPAPGLIARFDPALGPGIRLDAGVAAGSVIPAAFDSLVAKLIAAGPDRETARSRLAAALDDSELVVAGGASNKGWLREILEHPDFRSGGVTTRWLDVFSAERRPGGELAEPALVAAGILSYQRRRALARLNFFSDPSQFQASDVPSPQGLQVDLSHRGHAYRLQVYAVGSWRYRVHLDGRVASATLREEGAHTARLLLGERSYRVLYDVDEAGLRVELEGRAHRFGSRAAGEVRASTPAVVVGVDVAVGDEVRAGQALGLLEAMKMEIGFEAPVSGVVSELRVRSGQQVAAGEVLLVIDSSGQAPGDDPANGRIAFRETRDPLARLVPLGEAEDPDLKAADALPPVERAAAVESLRGELRRLLLGYDANPELAEGVVRFLEVPLPEELSAEMRRELADLGQELVLFADVARLFWRDPQVGVTGALGPSHYAQLRLYARRTRAGGAGVAPEFLELVRRALAHYGVSSLEPSDALDRAVLRLLGSQLSPELRDRLVSGVLRRVTELARRGTELSGAPELAEALESIASLRGLVGHGVADQALEARYVIFQAPGIEREAERTHRELRLWLDAAERDPTPPPESVLLHLSDAPRSVFDRVGLWLGDPDPHRRAIALAAHLRRLYSPKVPLERASRLLGRRQVECLALPEGRAVVGVTGRVEELEEALECGARASRVLARSRGVARIDALELLIPLAFGQEPPVPGSLERALAAAGAEVERVTVSFSGPRADLHWTYRSQGPGAGFRFDAGLHGLHPEAAEHLGLARLERFQLARLPAGERLACFHARSRELPADERIFVLADLRSHAPEDAGSAALPVAAFEHLFFEATRCLRSVLGERDPKRRLQSNQIFLNVAREFVPDLALVERLAHRLSPATRNLGLEKVVVRVRLLDPERPGEAAVATEIVTTHVTGERRSIERREALDEPLAPHSEYERRVAECRRRRLTYPYEIVRMLTEGGGSGALPPGRFEEYDLEPGAGPPRAVSVAGRPYGRNDAGIVFGVIDTPTDKVPEGMRRVLVLSDPTRSMGSLAAAECDRVIAALELAEALAVPLEWVPVSSGARIAMDSGTENLDATARVVRRLVEFTDAGGVVHVIVPGVNVGAQSYWNALATMGMHARGALIMTAEAAMVLTGRAALEASGSVAAEDEQAIGGQERIMGPNGEAQYVATDLLDAYGILYEHYRYSYVVPGESAPRPHPSRDPRQRSLAAAPCSAEGFERVGEIFDDAANPGRKRPFPMRDVMRALIDADGGSLERWSAWAGAETAIVWDAHLGGRPVCLIGIESRNVPRQGYRPNDGPESFSGGTLFPLSSKKVARALRAASGNRPAVILANLSGFDGSPESMRKLQLEYGAEIARAVVNFRGPLLFLVVSRYHGGAYVVFSRALNPELRASALRGSYASVIGGAPAAAVVFAREVQARAAEDPRVRALRGQRGVDRARHDALRAEVALEKQAELARDFDAIHTVERAQRVGSLEEIVEPEAMRPYLIGVLEQERRRR